MKPGTVIRLPDGREGTVVFHGLIGYGIQWGRIKVDVDEISTGDGNTFQSGIPPKWNWAPEAMLREPAMSERLGCECVGKEYTVCVEQGGDSE